MNDQKNDPVANFHTLAMKRASTSGLENGHPSILDETIQMTFQYLKATMSMPRLQEESPKSAAKAAELRSFGNLAFRDRRLDEALKLYTESIAVAPVGSQELAFAYGNRSAVLIYSGEYKFIECLVDINRAFQGNYPEAGKQKLVDRKNKCIAYLRKTVNNYKSKPGLVWSIPRKRDMDTFAEKCSPEMTDLPSQFPLPKVHFKNKLIPNASDKIKIANTGDNKNGIVATANIKPGEIIAIEKPVAWNLNVINPRRFCANCCSKTDALMPCPNCSVVMFCGTRCRDNALKLFHRIECQILCKLPTDEGKSLIRDDIWTVVRVLLVVTKQGEELDKIMNDPAYKLPFAKSFSHNVKKVFNAQDLSTVLGHSRVKDDQIGADFSSLLELSLFKSVFSWLYLLKQTTYFGDQITGIQNFDAPLTNRELYVVTLLLKLAKTTFQVLSEGLKGFAGFEKGITSQLCGQGLFPLINMFRHSCDPHVSLYSYENNLVCRSIRPIKAGEEISVCYYLPYFRCLRFVRIDELLEQYGFECTCRACEEEWPTAKMLPDGSSKIISNEISAKEFRKYRSRFQELQNSTAEELPSAENLEFLSKYSSILDRRYERPCREIIECESLFDLALSLCGNYYLVI